MLNKNLVKLLSLLISMLLGFFIMNKYFSKNSDFSNLALDEQTKSYYASKNEMPIHITKYDDFGKFKDGIMKRGALQSYLFLGNSQTHAINQYKQGDKNYVEYVSDSFNAKNIDVLSVSMPNINLQEVYLNYCFMMDSCKPNVVFVPVFYDDLREDAIRDDGSFEYLRKVGYRTNQKTPIGELVDKSIEKLQFRKVEAGSEVETKGVNAVEKTTQEIVENNLDDWMNKHSSVWLNRPEVRGNLFNLLYMARNTAFGIDAQTKRKKIQNRYDLNLEALSSLLQNSNERKIKVVLYIPPIRQDVEVPYVVAEYKQFKEDIKALSAKYNNVVFEDIDSIVPAKYWGSKAPTNLSGKPELDFMHFQTEGHLIFAKQLLTIIEKNNL